VAKAFLPELIRRDHGMVVTVSSLSAWMTIPNMVDYGASKAATMALHEGLTAELKTRYDAPRVRTVAVYPGHVRTSLFAGYEQNTEFLMPSLEPESVADAIFTKILTGTSGQVVLPKSGYMLTPLRAMPDWHAIRARANAEAFMKNFRGRQVIQTDHRDAKEGGPGDSTVLVSGEDAQKA
jgi:all-trans-retinol dehydrogenase (NAD+)